VLLRLLLLPLLLICGSAHAASLLRDVLYTSEGEVSRLDVQLGVSAELTAQASTGRDTRLQLKLKALSDGEANWSSMRVLFEEEDRLLQSVTMEGSSRKGFEITIEFTQAVEVVVLPQYNYQQLTLKFASQGDAKKLSKFGKPTATDPFAIVLETDRSAPASLRDVPRRFASKNVIYLLDTGGAEEQQLRLGFFPDRAQAQRVAIALREDFPDSELVQVSAAEETYAELFRLNPPDLVAQILPPAATEPVEEVHEPEVNLSIAQVTPSSLQAEPAVPEEPPPTPWIDREEADPTATELVLREAREAFAAEDYPKAITLYSKALNTAESDNRKGALEYLGVAREMNGQEAHAKQVYEQFLSDYDGTEEAARVSQRLAVLVALAASPSAPIPTRTAQRSDEWRVAGQIGQFYRRYTLSVDSNSSVPINGLFNDLNVIASHDGASLDQEARVTMSYLWDYTGDLDGRQFQVSHLAWKGFWNAINSGISIGRQTNSALGVLGRFDGVVLNHSFSEKLGIEVAGGAVVESTFDQPDSSRPFFSVGGEFVSASGNLVVEPFFIQQYVEDNILDRQAIGVQTQFRFDRGMVFSLLDYDLHHQALNNATFSSDIAFRQSRLFASYEYRRSPYLTTRNALIGQPYEELSELEKSLLDSELDQIAEDRTATSHTGRVGFTQTLSENWALTADLVASDYSETDSSANVLGTESNQTVYSSIQLRSMDPFGAASYSTMTLRRADSGTSTTTSMFFDNRFSLYDDWRLYPRLRVDYRTFDRDDDTQWSVKPSLRLDYRRGRGLVFEVEAGYDWTRRDMNTMTVDIDGSFVRAGYRALF
jgi:tetratricopeptide (TPR) repeat protein